MERITIHAASRASGRAMLAALSEFRTELRESEHGCAVIVTLGKGDAEIAAVLRALDDFVTQRADGPGHVELNGRSYVMHDG